MNIFLKNVGKDRLFSRVEDPGGVGPDPDPTFKKNTDSSLGLDPAVNKNNSGSNPIKTTRNWIQPNSHLFFFPIQKSIWLMHYREIKAGLRIRVEWIWIRTSRKTGSRSNPRKPTGSGSNRRKPPGSVYATLLFSTFRRIVSIYFRWIFIF